MERAKKRRPLSSSVFSQTRQEKPVAKVDLKDFISSSKLDGNTFFLKSLRPKKHPRQNNSESFIVANYSSRLKKISNKLKASNHNSELRMSNFIKQLGGHVASS